MHDVFKVVGFLPSSATNPSRSLDLIAEAIAGQVPGSGGAASVR
jgi:hypothetical protein